MTKPIYDDWATHYALLLEQDRLFYQTKILIPILKEIVRTKIPNNILDIGCGPGTFSRFLAASCTNYTGIDESTKMIELAKFNNKSLAHCFKASSLESYTDVDYDFALASFVHHYFPTLDEFFRLTSRHLSLHGTLVIASIHPLKMAIRVAKNTQKPIGSTYLDGTIYQTDFLSKKKKIPIYSNSISSTVNSAYKYGFSLRRLFEPPQVDLAAPNIQKLSLICFEFERVPDV